MEENQCWCDKLVQSAAVFALMILGKLAYLTHPVCSQPAINYNSNLLAGWNVRQSSPSLSRDQIILSLSSWSEPLQQIHLTFSKQTTNKIVNISTDFATTLSVQHWHCLPANCPVQRSFSILPSVWWRDLVWYTWVSCLLLNNSINPQSFSASTTNIHHLSITPWTGHWHSGKQYHQPQPGRMVFTKPRIVIIVLKYRNVVFVIVIFISISWLTIHLSVWMRSECPAMNGLFCFKTENWPDTTTELFV